MKNEILELIHQGHQWVEKCKKLARGFIFWPSMSSDIDRMAENCEACNCFAIRMNWKEPLLSHETPTLPWEKIEMDIFHYKNSNFLLVIDYYSQFMELVQFESHTADRIIMHVLY